jgi:two-component system, cell cycle response regulator
MDMVKIDNSEIRVLLVDDTPTNLEIAGKTLEKENYDLYIADNGTSALELIEKIDFDLILLDIMMPEMDGFETYRRMRKNEKNRMVPVIFLTAKVDIETVVTGFALGAVDYIKKPFNELELKARVKNHVELKKIREELEQKNAKLQEMYDTLQLVANTDPLTKLWNRREMTHRMEQEQNRFLRNGSEKTFSVVIADIDFFKNINDTYGHGFGDFILKSVADILQGNVRKQDVVARWGGEEFLLLLPETGADGAAIVANKLRKMIEESTFVEGDVSTKVTMTFGASVYKTNQSLDSLLTIADTALYEGKQKGRNRVVTYP